MATPEVDVCGVELAGEVCGRPSQPRAPADPQGWRPCPGHYRQLRAGEPYSALRTARGAGGQVSFRLPVELKTAAQIAADREGIDEGEWMRRAVADRLKAPRVGRPAPRAKLEDGEEMTIPGPGGPKR